MARLSKPSPAMIVAATAVVLAGTGGAFAAGLITSANIKDNTIRSVDIQNATVTPGDLHPGARTRVWHGSTYKGVSVPSGINKPVAYLEFTSAVAGYAAVSADFAIRARNTFDSMAPSDCRLATQIATTVGAPAATVLAAPGFADQWINRNLPTQGGAGTYLQFNGSSNRVVPVVKGLNRIYLNASNINCPGTIWGPINMMAVYVTYNQPATVVALP